MGRFTLRYASTLSVGSRSLRIQQPALLAKPQSEEPARNIAVSAKFDRNSYIEAKSYVP